MDLSPMKGRYLKGFLCLVLALWSTSTNAISESTADSPASIKNGPSLRTPLPTVQSDPPNGTLKCQLDCSYEVGQTFWPWHFVSTVITTALIVPVVTVYIDGTEVTDRFTRYSPNRNSLGSNYYEGPFPTSVVNGVTFTYPTGLVALNTVLYSSQSSGCSDQSDGMQEVRGLPDVPELYYLDANLTYVGDAEPTPTQPPSSVLEYLEKVPLIAALVGDNKIACCTASAGPAASAFIPQSTLTQLTAATAQPVRMTVSAAADAATKLKRFNNPSPTNAQEPYESGYLTPESSLGQGSMPPPPPSSMPPPPPSSTETLPPSSIQTPPPSSIETPPPSSIQTPPPSSIQTPPPSSVETPPPSSIETPPRSSIGTPSPSSMATPTSTPNPIGTPTPSSMGTPPSASIPYSSIPEMKSSSTLTQQTGEPNPATTPSPVMPIGQHSPHTSAGALPWTSQEGYGDAHGNNSPGNSKISDSSPDSVQQIAAFKTSPSPAEGGLQSQKPAQPSLTGPAPFSAISSALTQEASRGGQTLTAGGVATIDNTPVSLTTGESSILANGEFLPIAPSPTAITTGSEAIPVASLNVSPVKDGSNPQALTLDGQKLLPASVITIDNTPISLPTEGSAVVVNGKTIPVGSTLTAITIGSQKIPIVPQNVSPTALGSTPHAVTLNGKILNPGSVITIDNTPVSLAPTGSSLIVNGNTFPIGSTPTGIAIGSQILSITPNVPGSIPTALVLNGQTLQPGGNAMTISSGVEVSLPSSGTDVVLVSGTSTTTEGLGPAILSGLGVVPTETTLPSGGAGAHNTSNGSAMIFMGGARKVIDMGHSAFWVLEAVAMTGFMCGLWFL